MKNKCHLSNPVWNPVWDPVLPHVLSDWLVLKVTRLLIGPTLPGPPSLSSRIKNPEWSRLRGYKSIAPGFITVSVDSLSCGAILGFTKAKSETQWSLRVLWVLLTSGGVENFTPSLSLVVASLRVHCLC